MQRQFAIRFEPPGNSHAVPLDVFVEAISALAAGLSSLKNNFSPRWADRIQIKKAEAERQLAISILPAEPGSLVQPFAVGHNSDQQEILFHDAGAAFIRFSGAEFSAFIHDKPTTIFSVHVGECFLRAGEVARRKGIELGIAERRRMPAGEIWRPIIPLTRKLTELQRSLKTRKERAPRPIRTQLLGHIENLNAHPLFMMLKVKDHESFRVSLTNDLKADAHALWGKQALVTIVGRESGDEKIVDATAIAIKGLVVHEDPVEVYLSTKGAGRDIWGTETAQEYMRLIRERD